MIAVKTFLMGMTLEENASPEKAEHEFATADFMQHILEDTGRGLYPTEPLLTLINPKILPIISHLCPIIQNSPDIFLNQGYACTRQQHTQE